MTTEYTYKQQAILDATLELIGKLGFHGTSMSAIAKRASVGAGTIYRYYASKEDLINALYYREKSAVNAFILSGYAPEMPVREGLRMLWRNALRARQEFPGRFRFLEQYYNSPFIDSDSRRVREQLMAEYVEIVERGVASGALRDLPRPILLSMLFGPLSSLATAGRLDDVDLTDDLVDQAFDTVWRSIARP